LRKPPFPEVPSQVLYILERLRQAQKQAFIVGGAVRDALMGRPIKDWDVATSAKVDLVRSLFPKVIPTGARHGTVTVKVGGLEVEVSAFRGRTIVEDLGHRDFTVDAMAWDPQGPTPIGSLRRHRGPEGPALERCH
jgi:tRNA nucleotidyltransferase (CCA-adding enzyme)